jgi:hypothetical protein
MAATGLTARANITPDDSGAKTMNSLVVFASSAVFSPDTSSITVGLDITSVPAPVQSINLVTQPPNSVAESPGPNETPRLFLPQDTVVPIASNTILTFTVSATIQTSSGSCSVGSTTKTIDPNQPPDSSANRKWQREPRRVPKGESRENLVKRSGPPPTRSARRREALCTALGPVPQLGLSRAEL